MSIGSNLILYNDLGNLTTKVDSKVRFINYSRVLLDSKPSGTYIMNEDAYITFFACGNSTSERRVQINNTIVGIQSYIGNNYYGMYSGYVKKGDKVIIHAGNISAYALY